MFLNEKIDKTLFYKIQNGIKDVGFYMEFGGRNTIDFSYEGDNSVYVVINFTNSRFNRELALEFFKKDKEKWNPLRLPNLAG